MKWRKARAWGGCDLWRSELLPFRCGTGTGRLQECHVRWQAGKEGRQGEEDQHEPPSSSEQAKASRQVDIARPFTTRSRCRRSMLKIHACPPCEELAWPRHLKPGQMMLARCGKIQTVLVISSLTGRQRSGSCRDGSCTRGGRCLAW